MRNCSACTEIKRASFEFRWNWVNTFPHFSPTMKIHSQITNISENRTERNRSERAARTEEKNHPNEMKASHIKECLSSSKWLLKILEQWQKRCCMQKVESMRRQNEDLLLYSTLFAFVNGNLRYTLMEDNQASSINLTLQHEWREKNCAHIHTQMAFSSKCFHV